MKARPGVTRKCCQISWDKFFVIQIGLTNCVPVRGMQEESGSPLNGATRRRVPFAEIYALRKDGEKKGSWMFIIATRKKRRCMNNCGDGELTIPEEIYKYAHALHPQPSTLFLQ